MHKVYAESDKFIVRVGENGAASSINPNIEGTMSDEEITAYLQRCLNSVNAEIDKQQDEGDGFVEQRLYILRREYSCLLRRR